MEERIKQAVEGISTEKLDKVWKFMNARINQNVAVYVGHIEQDNI